MVFLISLRSSWLKNWFTVLWINFLGLSFPSLISKSYINCSSYICMCNTDMLFFPISFIVQDFLFVSIYVASISAIISSWHYRFNLLIVSCIQFFIFCANSQFSFILSRSLQIVVKCDISYNPMFFVISCPVPKLLNLFYSVCTIH